MADKVHPPPPLPSADRHVRYLRGKKTDLMLDVQPTFCAWLLLHKRRADAEVARLKGRAHSFEPAIALALIERGAWIASTVEALIAQLADPFGRVEWLAACATVDAIMRGTVDGPHIAPGT